MDKIWCEVRAGIFDGRLLYRGIVRMGSAATWRGQWREKQIQAIRDAEKAAEAFYDKNHHVLSVARTIGAWAAISSPGIVSRARRNTGNGSAL